MEIERLPGVEQAALANYAPLHAVHGDYQLTPESGDGSRHCAALVRDVDPGYLKVLGIPLLAGRDLELADDTWQPPPVLINRSAAQALFGHENPIGKRLKNRDRRVPVLEVVGLVGDVRQLELTTEPGPQVFLPFGYAYSQAVLARLAPHAGNLAPAIRAAVKQLDAALAAPEIVTMDVRFAEETAKPRFYVALLGAFALVGLTLAAIGIYGVMSYTVARRTHEFGIRMALGAQPGDVLRLVLGAGMRVALAGAVVGLAGALAATRLLAALLFGVRPGDPLTFAYVLALLVAVALLACYLAARKATAVDPSSALRAE